MQWRISSPPVHLDRRVQDASQQSHGFEDLERTWLHTNGFGISLRLQADRRSARDEYLWLRRVWHALIMLPI